MPYSSSGVTANTFRYGPEVRKLHLEFQVKSGDSVHRGEPVILNADGTISPAGAAALEGTVIGVSIHELKSAYEVNNDSNALNLVVIAMRGYAVLDAAVGDIAASNATDFPAMPAGPVQWYGYAPALVASNVANMSVPGTKVSVNTTDPATQGINTFIALDPTIATPGTATVAELEDLNKIIGWSLTQVAADVGNVGSGLTDGQVYAGGPILVVIKD